MLLCAFEAFHLGSKVTLSSLMLRQMIDRLGNCKHGVSQGYNTAWLDADAALTDNPFATFSRWFDLVATWSGGDDEPLQKIEKVVGYELKVSLLLG